MKDTNLVQFIATAGIIGAALTFILQALADRYQRRQELRGLLRLLRGEVDENLGKIEIFRENPAQISNRFYPGWDRTVWKENAPKIAHLISEGAFQVLVSHDQKLIKLEKVRELIMAPQLSDNGRKCLVTSVENKLEDLEASGNNVIKVLDNNLQSTAARGLRAMGIKSPR